MLAYAPFGKVIPKGLINEITTELILARGNLPVTGVDSIGGRNTSSKSKYRNFKAKFAHET
jgi:hypothetical protein